jgi:hypothetical protein
MQKLRQVPKRKQRKLRQVPRKLTNNFLLTESRSQGESRSQSVSKCKIEIKVKKIASEQLNEQTKKARAAAAKARARVIADTANARYLEGLEPQASATKEDQTLPERVSKAATAAALNMTPDERQRDAEIKEYKEILF